jgi:hypothetical protein
MSRVQIYAGVEQVDVASLTTSGVTYRCFVWLAAGGARVEASIFVDGEDGQLTLVDSAIVASVVNDYVDCPRVLAVGTLFVCHWIDSGNPGTFIHRSLFDVTAIATGWVAQGSVPTYSTNQYDHAYVFDRGEFIVSHRTAAGTITTIRYEAPYSWIDTVWSQADAGLTIADTVLAVHANESDDDVVLISYQDTSLMRTIRRDASAGGNMATAETFADLLDGDMQFTAVTHVRTALDDYLVVAEAAPDDDQALGGDFEYSRLVAWRQISASTAVAAHESQWCRNLHLLSRAWTWASGTTGVLEVFVAVSYKTINDGGEFEQMFGYVVRLDHAALAGANAAGVIRPIPCSAIMDGSIDARPHGSGPNGSLLTSIGCRVNHLSHVTGPPTYTLGPDVASVVFSVTQWGRNAVIEDANNFELQPVEAGAGWVKYHHEPPWTVRRDDKQPTQPDTPAWRGVSKALQLPVPTPAGLALSGGVVTAYDGQQPVELGFLWSPEILAAEPTNGGAVGDALTYTWFVTATWKDARGNVHNSPPSRPVSAALAANQYCVLRIRCLNLGMKDDDVRYPVGGSIYFQVWRNYAVGGALVTEGSEDLGTAVYLFRSEYGNTGAAAGGVAPLIENLPRNDPSAFSITAVAGFANSDVSIAELAPYQLNLETLQWSPPPPIPHQPLGPSCLWQGRLFGVDPVTNAIVWSEEITRQGSRWIWPYFLDTNVFRLDSVGEVTALGEMDDALVIYTRDAIFALTGDPGAGGSGPSMSLQTIARGIGCIEPRSLVAYTEGQFFQSAKGLHRLSRGQGVDYPGAAVEDLVRAAGNVRGAVHLEDTHQIAFPLQAEPGTGPLAVRPRLAVYDYRVGKWATRTLPMLAQSSTASRLNETAHAIAWRGRQGESSLAVLEQGGLAIQRSRNDTVYADVSASGSAPVCLDITTEWFHPAGIVGQWLCDQVSLQTERVHAGPLTIQAWFNVTGVFDGTYNAASPHWTATYANAPAFMPLRFNILKLSWVKLRIFEPGTAPSTENVRLVSLTVHWRALPRARTVARV